MRQLCMKSLTCLLFHTLNSSEIRLVQKVNSKNTNRKILISKNTHSLAAREFFESDKPQDRIADTWADKRNQIANRKESVQVWLDDLEFCKTLIAPLSKFPAYKDCGVADVKKYMRSCCQEQRADSDNRYEWLNDLYQSHQEQLAQLRQNELDRENYLESRQQPQASINAEAVKTPPEMDEKAKAIFDRLMKTRGLKT